MRSTADALRASLRERLLSMTAGERIALTAELAESDVEIFAGAQNVSREDARRILARRRSLGRPRSCANEVDR